MVGSAFMDVEKKAIRVSVVDGISIGGSDIEIGAVEIKDASTDNRVSVTDSGELNVRISSDASGTKDVNVTNSNLNVSVTNQPTVTIDDSTPVSTSVSNFPSDYPDSVAHTKLDTINSSISADQPRHITNLPTDYPDATAHNKLDAINTSISSEQPRSVTNFPTEYPLPQSQANDLTDFMAHDVDEPSSTLTYVGKVRKDGTWVIMKIDTASGTAIRYAGSKNNSSYSDYASAWNDRDSLTYGLVNEAV